MAVLHLRIAPPPAFRRAPRLVLALDGGLVYDGPYDRGFERSLSAPPGPHRLSAALHVDGALFDRRSYELYLDASASRPSGSVLEARLRFRRVLGRFAALQLRRW